eukprot:COSAG02_NODE_117_length_35386_cov_78.819163_12_plen_61_part_00
MIDLVSSDEDEPEPPPRKKVRRPFIESWADYFADTADAVADELGGLTEAEFDERLHDMGT